MVAVSYPSVTIGCVEFAYADRRTIVRPFRGRGVSPPPIRVSGPLGRNPVHRRSATRAIAAATLVTALVGVAGCTGDSAGIKKTLGGHQSLEKITYLTAAGTTGRDAYAYVAKEKGYFADAGFDVDIRAGSGTGGNLKAIVGGQARFAPVDLTEALLAAGRNAGRAPDFTVVAGVQQRTMAAIIALDGSGVARPKDLEGKTLAGAPGSVVRALFDTYAALADVDIHRVTWVDGSPQSLAGSLVAGRVAGIGKLVVDRPAVESAAGGGRAVLLPYSDFMQDLYGDVLISSTSYLRGHPDKVRRFTAALLRGLQDAVGDPAGAARILKKYVPGADVNIVKGEVQLMAAYVRADASGAPAGALDSQRVARTIAILQGAGAIPAGLNPEQVVDFDIVNADLISQG